VPKRIWILGGSQMMPTKYKSCFWINCWITLIMLSVVHKARFFAQDITILSDEPGTWRKFVTSCKDHTHKHNCRPIICCKAMRRPQWHICFTAKIQDGRQKYSQMPFIKQYIIVCQQESQKTHVFRNRL